MIPVDGIARAFNIRPEDLAMDLQINPTNIDDAIIRQAGLYAYYASAHADAEGRLRQAKLERDVFSAALDKQIRDTALARGQKLTEKQVEMQIMLHPDWKARVQRVNELEAAVSQLEGLVRAFAQKKDMLVTHATNLRAERQQGFSIRNQPGGPTNQPPW